MHRFLERLHAPERPVLVFDGATGTSLQQMDLGPDDFGGAALEGCNENLVVTRPDAVQEVHRQFLEAGCDVIETDTFGATSLVLAEYDLQDQAYELNVKAAQLAREMADRYSTPEKPRFVAGSMGPTTKLPTLGHVGFDEMRDSFAEQGRGLLAGNVDLFIIETCQDPLQIKAALAGLEQAFAAAGERRPLMVSVTMETTGTMLVGSDIAAVVAILEPFPIDVLGLNCATGPEQMKEHVRYLSAHAPFVVSCIPNAGLPENVGGVAHYRLTPVEMKMAMHHFIEDLGVQVIGGCCGTTPAHIGALAELAQEMTPAERGAHAPGTTTAPLAGGGSLGCLDLWHDALSPGQFLFDHWRAAQRQWLQEGARAAQRRRLGWPGGGCQGPGQRKCPRARCQRRLRRPRWREGHA